MSTTWIMTTSCDLAKWSISEYPNIQTSSQSGFRSMIAWTMVHGERHLRRNWLWSVTIQGMALLPRLVWGRLWDHTREELESACSKIILTSFIRQFYWAKPSLFLLPLETLFWWLSSFMDCQPISQTRESWDYTLSLIATSEVLCPEWASVYSPLRSGVSLCSWFMPLAQPSWCSHVHWPQYFWTSPSSSRLHSLLASHSELTSLDEQVQLSCNISTGLLSWTWCC